MKILFYLRIEVMGGAERYLLTLLPELKKKDIQVGFFCTRQNGNDIIISHFKDHFGAYGIPVYVCESGSIIKAAWHLSAVIKKNGYTILSAHLMHAEIVSWLSKMLLMPTCKLVTTKHGYLQKFMDRHGLDHTKINRLSLSYQVEKLIQSFVVDNFAVSKGLADFYINTGICKSGKMTVIYHGIDPEALKEAGPAIRYSNNQLLVIARLRKFKGHHFLIAAMTILCKEIKDLKLVILGTGEEMQQLKKMVQELELEEWIVFEGYKDNVHDYIIGSDIVIAPSLAEPFGLVVLEAYSCSKPVVAFDVTAFNENIIDKVTGYLVPPYDVKALAQKIKYLLLNKAIATKAGQNGFSLLEDKFSLKTAVEKTIGFYQSIL